MRILPGQTWWSAHQYGRQEPVDDPRCPVELNYYKRLWVRWAFADMKVVALIAAGVLVGVLNWVFLKFWGVWFV